MYLLSLQNENVRIGSVYCNVLQQKKLSQIQYSKEILSDLFTSRFF